ncbi:hypothetical protein NKF26_10985 [Haladaptatus sp. AB618]|uniref:hypothetical protein n=1 Tax=Haladaptatus sp. AB618 TaxID=2934173 RepID=UPI00209BDB7E|nr:hypothetical protein [Haladaptatus sp. AB618]MCO8254327.1 hypothetical protein [Haladaptatus sp. AB618]
MSMRPIAKAALVALSVFVASLAFEQIGAPWFVNALFVGLCLLLVAITSNRNGVQN